MQANLSQSIEAILFATAEPYTYAVLAKMLEVSIEEIREAVVILKSNLEGHSIVLTEMNEVVSLVTASQYSGIIETIRKNELNKELTKASAETLAIIAYTPGISKSQIEFIRGVNVSYSLRALMMRGLIESKGQGRAIAYHPTVELLHHFGVTSLTDLPEYVHTKTKIDALLTGVDTQGAY